MAHTYVCRRMYGSQCPHSVTHVPLHVCMCTTPIHRPETPRPQVLNTINVLRNEGMLMDLKCDDLEERFRTRVLYAANPEELSQCNLEMAEACQVKDASLLASLSGTKLWARGLFAQIHGTHPAGSVIPTCCYVLFRPSKPRMHLDLRASLKPSSHALNGPLRPGSSGRSSLTSQIALTTASRKPRSCSQRQPRSR